MLNVWCTNGERCKEGLKTNNVCKKVDNERVNNGVSRQTKQMMMHTTCTMNTHKTDTKWNYWTQTAHFHLAASEKSSKKVMYIYMYMYEQ